MQKKNEFLSITEKCQKRKQLKRQRKSREIILKSGLGMHCSASSMYGEEEKSVKLPFDSTILGKNCVEKQALMTTFD